MPSMTRLFILTPVYNDWASFAQLLVALDKAAPATHMHVLAVNDGAAPPPDVFPPLDHIFSVEVLHLVRNLGHQRAIAVGLVYLFRNDDFDAVVVMDADGEDRPEDVAALLAAMTANQIVVAQRAQRSEGVTFRAFYVVYRLLFWLLTGQVIDFGNFCAIPRGALARLAYDANLWNNLAATIARSRLPFARLPTRRGTRYAGQSTMNIESLIIHGLSAISVFGEVVFVRVLLFSLGVAALAFLGLIAVVLIRLFTDLAIPGWATSATGLLIIIIFQTVLLSAGATFVLLAGRSQIALVPAHDILKFVKTED